MSRDIFNGFYNGRKVLVTGHTGFKGSWLSIWLHSLGAEVIGVAKEPYSDKDNYVLSGLKDKIVDLKDLVSYVTNKHEELLEEVK